MAIWSAETRAEKRVSFRGVLKRHLSVVFRLEQKTIGFLAKDYKRPEGGPQSEDPGEHGLCAAKWIERQTVHQRT